ncbi:putative transposon-encoded protein [Methanococcus voltae]|uniref:Putative transposon-encoded protein n=1 Tax=Methanococcus voltae TaxID=2188 RepID=A0A8J7RIM7_METVO|nr:DUF2080 family transposase-associated protein [Methanococcus voltae]MBP2202150.1 putative transposon-encoded protein [Methanococcus voltae]
MAEVVHQFKGTVRPVGNSGRVHPSLPKKYIGKTVVVQVIDEEFTEKELKK